MRPEDYLVDPGHPNTKYNSTCQLGFLKNQEDFWLVGDILLRGYYSVHDDDSGLFGLAPHATSLKREISNSNWPSQALLIDTDSSQMQTYMSIALIFAAVLALVGLVVYCWPSIWKWIHGDS